MPDPMPVNWRDIGQPLVLSADGTPLGTLQAGLNPNRHGLARAVVSQDAGKIRPDDLSAA